MDGTPALDLLDLAIEVLDSAVRGNSSHSNDVVQGNLKHKTFENSFNVERIKIVLRRRGYGSN